MESSGQMMPSLTEWMAKIDESEAEKLREEDNSKRDRLELLYQTVGLPYDRPERMMAVDIIRQTPLFHKVIKKYGQKQCALRLIPIKQHLPKLRARGQTLNYYLQTWFPAQNINANDYKVEVVPHCDKTIFSANFIVNNTCVWGEAVSGPLLQLSSGSCLAKSTLFVFDFSEWYIEPDQTDKQKILSKAINYLRVPVEKQQTLKKSMGAEFNTNGYLKGFFEYVVWPHADLFVDYNRLIPKLIHSGSIPKMIKMGNKLNGLCVYRGIAKGIARIITDPKTERFDKGDILICKTTTIDYLKMMIDSAAIVTEQGNLLSHPAIVSRELKKPCLIKVCDATQKIQDGKKITVDANKGTVILH